MLMFSPFDAPCRYFRRPRRCYAILPMLERAIADDTRDYASMMPP